MRLRQARADPGWVPENARCHQAPAHRSYTSFTDEAAMAEAKQPRSALIAAREELGWTQAVAAERVGVAESTWQRWERGQADPRLPQMVRVAGAFEVGLDQVRSWFDGRTW